MIVGLATGAGGGTAVVQVLAWILKTYTNVDMDTATQLACASVISSFMGVLAAHFTPVNKSPEQE
jgi:uncharacterized membrane protein YfcA